MLSQSKQQLLSHYQVHLYIIDDPSFVKEPMSSHCFNSVIKLFGRPGKNMGALSYHVVFVTERY